MKVKQLLSNPFGYVGAAIAGTFLCGQILMLTSLPTSPINWPIVAAIFPLMAWTVFITIRRKQWGAVGLMGLYIVAWVTTYLATKNAGTTTANPLGYDLFLATGGYICITVILASVWALAYQKQLLRQFFDSNDSKLTRVSPSILGSGIICAIKSVFGAGLIFYSGRYIQIEGNGFLFQIDYVLYGLMLALLGFGTHATTQKEGEQEQRPEPAEIQQAA